MRAQRARPGPRRGHLNERSTTGFRIPRVEATYVEDRSPAPFLFHDELHVLLAATRALKARVRELVAEGYDEFDAKGAVWSSYGHGWAGQGE